AIRLPVIFALTSIIFGILLWWADVTFARHKTTDDLTWRGAVLLGLSQAVALIPGTSRSGITMMTARMMSMGRAEAARFSMLMSLPVIGAGGIFALYRLSQAGPGVTGSPGIGLTVAVLSFVAAYVSISLFMTWVSRIGMFPFMVYRIAFGIGLLLWIGL
ncbi:MAG: undecaprenyl-diphosphate phosphatase, partial [Hyphomonadaceae bacterium]|nr:undecaprenyl-diphosphate phosphatase [Hyphomonadaceae bacterium]